MEIGSLASSSEQDTDPPPPRPAQRKPGGWKAIVYILGNESFEKLASMSLIANLTLYLRTRYNMAGILLVNVVAIWSGTSNIATLAGAVISDAYVGRFLTLFLGGIASLLGMGTMTLTAGIPQLRPPSCDGQSQCLQPQGWQLGFLFTGLGLLGVGAGCIRPCNIAFGADQFDTTTKKGRSQLESFFNWWYFSFAIALVIALSAVVYIQTNISWVLGFAIPTACLALSILVFLMGRHTYIYRKPQGSIFVDMARVIVASFKKRRINLASSSEQQYSFYNPSENESESLVPKLRRTDRFKCLDKAALLVDLTELDSQGRPKNTWTLCTIQQVEQMKCIVGIVPVWFSGVGCFLAMDQQHIFGILQALQMNRSIGARSKIPPGWLSLTPMIALSLWIFVYERIYVPQAKKLLKRDGRLTAEQRIKIGIVMSILCMLVAGILEGKRRQSALKQGSFASPLTVFMLLPQFLLSGLIEAFAAVTIMEFFTVQMPETMRSVAGSIFFLSLSIASYLSSLIVNVIHAITGKNGRSPWLGGPDLNENRLEYYYYIIAIVGAANYLYFTFFACHYVSGSDIVGGRKELSLANSISHGSGHLSKDDQKELETNLP